MLSVADALAIVLADVAVRPAEVVGLDRAQGRVLAEDVAARVSQPSVDVSAMDGYAVRAADIGAVPTTLRLIGESAAGARYHGTLGRGDAVRIFTGAPLPDGADAVVIQEQTEAGEGTVTVTTRAAAGRWIRRRGLDYQQGAVMLNRGRRLTARDVGLAAGMNVTWVSVRQQPRVAVVATGNEIVLPGEPAGEDQIYGSNSFAVAGYVRSFGGEPVVIGIARDDVDSLDHLLQTARRADLIVTIGGASVGDHDLVLPSLADRGFNLGFYTVAMRPGKPLIYGRLETVPLLGLPGNPVSAGVTALLFLKPLIESMLGMEMAPPAPALAILGRDLPANDQRQDYLRARLSRDERSRLVATPFASQDSSMLSLLAAADALVVVPPNAPALAAGCEVEIVPLTPGTGGF